jgi:hypothetical protein
MGFDQSESGRDQTLWRREADSAQCVNQTSQQGQVFSLSSVALMVQVVIIAARNQAKSSTVLQAGLVPADAEGLAQAREAERAGALALASK